MDGTSAIGTSQSSTRQIQIELASATSYDQFEIDGDALVGGIINVSTIGGLGTENDYTRISARRSAAEGAANAAVSEPSSLVLLAIPVLAATYLRCWR